MVAQLAKRQIIIDTRDKYAADTSQRAVTFIGNGNRSGSCYYQTGDGKRRCAVGQYLTDPLAFASQVGDVDEVWNGSSISLDRDLREEVRGHPLLFWDALQTFHDQTNNWDQHGLTAEGETAYERLIAAWN